MPKGLLYMPAANHAIQSPRRNVGFTQPSLSLSPKILIQCLVNGNCFHYSLLCGDGTRSCVGRDRRGLFVAVMCELQLIDLFVGRP
jgi:hypothetical protein